MNNKLRIYLDTSAVSYLDQQDVPEKMKITKEAWKELCSGKYEVVVSETLLSELSECTEEKSIKLFEFLNELPLSILVDETVEIDNLAVFLIDNGLVKSNSYIDALHIATAIEYDCDVLISWDMKHIVNINTSNRIKQLCFYLKHKKILSIYTPEYLISEEE